MTFLRMMKIILFLNNAKHFTEYLAVKSSQQLKYNIHTVL